MIFRLPLFRWTNKHTVQRHQRGRAGTMQRALQRGVNEANGYQGSTLQHPDVLGAHEIARAGAGTSDAEVVHRHVIPHVEVVAAYGGRPGRWWPGTPAFRLGKASVWQSGDLKWFKTRKGGLDTLA